ncbi:probable LRR receptor-like serine/threonine-protein kinase At4g20940 [Durio zibethinus]|uniref:Probable LRR receptor-like serine/threonine-protein kinase At4g20940 n=1 Tax=Durio zibethinus TaxID=66656 RepID=A0A6P5ZPA7_DURZI|nr:probable LRR receptor-like serine/threonine-protein kinase At4g20940 [Durio zibethinus]
MQRFNLVFLLVTALAHFEALLELKKDIEKDPSGKVLASWDSKSLASDGVPRIGLVGNWSFPVIVGLKMLRNISISSNQWTGTMSKIGSIPSLEFLDLSSTFPSGFSSLKRLKYVDFWGYHNFLSQLESVVHVDLSSNQLSGSLDMGLGSSSFVSSIQSFYASNNQLVGTIPSFNFIVSLRIHWLGNNQLSGSLPEALLQDSAKILSELDLSLDQLKFTFSFSEVSNCVCLCILYHSSLVALYINLALYIHTPCRFGHALAMTFSKA